jgi:hypothetical protein
VTGDPHLGIQETQAEAYNFWLVANPSSLSRITIDNDTSLNSSEVVVISNLRLWKRPHEEERRPRCNAMMTQH